ncbi:OLC1v1006257C2 [Oldenlandia corymbosa var. corymbosa]|nr:OLC1v1006257C2 [Oldenlandia corymbosa var. corymbosa]
MNFVEFVHMVLLNHSPNLSINRFRLKLYNFKFESICFYTWVNIAIARNLRVLDLDIDFKDHNFRKDNYKSQLPGALYTCETLEVLKLSGLGVYIKVIRTVCLPKLTDLELKKVTYESDDSLRNLIPGCPLLQSLRIERHRQDNMVVCTIFSRVLKHFRYFFATTTGSNNNAALHFKLEIDAPALEFIDLTDFGSKEIISLQELRCLNEVYVHSSTPHKSTIGLLQAFHHVKSLVLSTTTMSTLMGANHRLILASFERLTKLFVPIDCCDQLRSVMDLIDSCAALEILNIMNNRSVQQSQSRNWRDPESVPKCLLNSVTEFSYSGFQGLEDEMAMFKFISKHALLLTRVHITSPLGWGPRPEEEFSSLEKIFMPSSGLYPELYASQPIFLPKLTGLELILVRYESEEAFGNLISGCPLLQSLIIQRFAHDRMVDCRISSPVLKRLEYIREGIRGPKDDSPLHPKVDIDTPALECLLIKVIRSKEIISVGRLTSLNEVDVDIRPNAHDLTVGLIQGFGCVEVLKFSSRTLENLIADNNQLSAISFERLTKLVVRIDYSKQLSYLMDLMAGCPCLELLSITHESKGQIRRREWRDPITVPTCLLTSLTELYYRGFRGLEDDEMDMFRFISSHASVMKRVVISQPRKWAAHPKEKRYQTSEEHVPVLQSMSSF